MMQHHRTSQKTLQAALSTFTVLFQKSQEDGDIADSQIEAADTSSEDTCSPLPNMSHKLSYSVETTRSTTMYSHAHSLSDGWQNFFICLSSVSCKAVCLLCFIKGLRLGSIKVGPCLPCSSFCSPGYTGRAGTPLLLGHRAMRKVGWEEKRAGFSAFYIQT